MKLVLASSLVLLFTLHGPSSLLAGSVECSVPPGPSGRITCAGEDYPICEVTGRRIEGECLSKPNVSSVDELQKWILGRMLDRPSSAEEFQRYKGGLASGRVTIGESVFTFDLGISGNSDVQPQNEATQPPDSEATELPSKRLVSCTGCVGLLGQQVCDTKTGQTADEAKQKVREIISRLSIEKVIAYQNIAWDCKYIDSE